MARGAPPGLPVPRRSATRRSRPLKPIARSKRRCASSCSPRSAWCASSWPNRSPRPASRSRAVRRDRWLCRGHLDGVEHRGQAAFQVRGGGSGRGLGRGGGESQAARKYGAAVSPLVAQKLARVVTILSERIAWSKPLAQAKRMRQWALEAEESLDGRWAQGEVVKSQCHGGTTPGYLARDSGFAVEG
jgi:hypothetical protein